MMAVLLLMIVAAIFAERRLAQLEGENLLVNMNYHCTLHYRSISNVSVSDIPVYATDVEILQQMQMNVGSYSLSDRLE